ncbi:MAG: DUF58 domain-containing protein [Candidatus Heimdallarchaeota archaeon]|nr:DUF58 domain-containing protein [Candidatus Heimdallarchaeota archaeon]
MAERFIISKRIQNLALVAREKVSSFLSGNRRSLYLGNGNEFADLREYRFGDEIRHIDWRQSAKRHEKLIVREFEVERNANVVFLLDASASMMLNDSERMKSAVIAVASLAHAVISNKDFFGFGAYTERLNEFLPPKGGKLHEHLIYRKLLNIIPEGKTNIGEALKQVATNLKQRSIIIVLTDLHDNLDEMAKGFKITKGFKHEVQVVQFADVGEFELPDKVGKVKFIHPDTGKPTIADLTDPYTRGKYTYEIAKQQLEISKFKRKLRGMNIRVVSAYTGDVTEKILISYFSAKQRGRSL